MSFDNSSFVWRTPSTVILFGFLPVIYNSTQETGYINVDNFWYYCSWQAIRKMVCLSFLHKRKKTLVTGIRVPYFEISRAYNLETIHFWPHVEKSKMHLRSVHISILMHLGDVQFLSVFCNQAHYAQKTFKMWSLGSTLSILDDLTATSILRAIKFWWIQTVQKCHFWQFLILWTLNLGLKKLLKLIKNQNSEPLKLAKTTFLDRLNLPKFEFT